MSHKESKTFYLSTCGGQSSSSANPLTVAVAKPSGTDDARPLDESKAEEKAAEKPNNSKAHAEKMKKKAVKKKVDLHHMGVIEDGLKMQKLAREARSAHGAKKKELRARVMSLEQDIKGAFAKIDDFGKRAETKFSREEAKVKTGKH